MHVCSVQTPHYPRDNVTVVLRPEAKAKRPAVRRVRPISPESRAELCSPQEKGNWAAPKDSDGLEVGPGLLCGQSARQDSGSWGGEPGPDSP